MNNNNRRFANSPMTEFMCTYCGRKERRTVNEGRPMPGNCPRRRNSMPHRWVINRKMNF